MTDCKKTAPDALRTDRLLAVQNAMLTLISTYERKEQLQQAASQKPGSALSAPVKRDETLHWERIHLASSARIAKDMAVERGVNPELAAIATALHDMGRIVTGKQKDHAHQGSEPARELLEQLNLFSEEEIQLLTTAVYNHSDKDVIGSEIEEIVKRNPDTVVVIDEAYVDFGAESAVALTKKYDNLLVVQTFSKSRSMAGARLGFAIGCKALIADLNKIKFSTNPYNVNRLTCAAGEATLAAQPYYDANCKKIIETRAWTAEKLAELGFSMTDSKANFLFAKHESMDGEALYLALKARGILVRHFSADRISPYLRITVGAPEEMQALINALTEILPNGGTV